MNREIYSHLKPFYHQFIELTLPIVNFTNILNCFSASGAGQGSIDHRIEQAMVS